MISGICAVFGPAAADFRVQRHVRMGGFLKQYISVIGLGNFGTALANYLANLGHDVLGFSRRHDVVNSINLENTHPLFLKDILLSTNLRATKNLGECLRRSIVVIALPAHALGEFVASLKDFTETYRQDSQQANIAPPLFICATKGLPGDAFILPSLFLSSAIRESFQLRENHELAEPVVLTGPCFAYDLARGLPASLVAASSFSATSETTAKLFASSQVKIYISDDPRGAQIGGIVKNVIAIATGISDGLGLGESARAGLITRGLAEILRFALANGAKPETIFGLSGLGDLSMTCSSSLSRNHTVGYRVAKGQKLSAIISELGSVAEGVRSTPIVADAAKSASVEMPITQSVLSILNGQMAPADAVRALVLRPVKKEF